MAKIQLAQTGFSIIPEGRYVFKITACEYKQKFQKIEVSMETAKGQVLKESYMLSTDGGNKAFAYMAKTAMHDYNLDEIEPSDLIGKYISAEVYHTVKPHQDDPNKTVTFVNTKDKQEAYGFEQEIEAESEKAATVKPDLSFLN